jgi:hypothetical protein
MDQISSLANKKPARISLDDCTEGELFCAYWNNVCWSDDKNVHGLWIKKNGLVTILSIAEPKGSMPKIVKLLSNEGIRYVVGDDKGWYKL